MILSSKETTIAYRCPSCGKIILSPVGVFALSGDMKKLKCDCGESELTITYTADSKVRLSVPCIFCPYPHNYLISTNTFFERDLFTLACTYSGIDICFIGSEEKVLEATREASEDLNEMLVEAGLDDIGLLRPEASETGGRYEFDDPQIADIIRFMICELKDDDKIFCRCENNTDSDYGFDFKGENIRIFCRSCGAYTELPMTSVDAANRFLSLNELVLDKTADKGEFTE